LQLWIARAHQVVAMVGGGECSLHPEPACKPDSRRDEHGIPCEASFLKLACKYQIGHVLHRAQNLLGMLEHVLGGK